MRGDNRDVQEKACLGGGQGCLGQGSCLYWPDLGKQDLTHQLQQRECACIYVCVSCEGCGLSGHKQSDCGHALHVCHVYKREHIDE